MRWRERESVDIATDPVRDDWAWADWNGSAAWTGADQHPDWYFNEGKHAMCMQCTE